MEEEEEEEEEGRFVIVLVLELLMEKGSHGCHERERGTTITGYILIFSGAKNSYIAIWHHYC